MKKSRYGLDLFWDWCSDGRYCRPDKPCYHLWYGLAASRGPFRFSLLWIRRCAS